jgi:hypothetical protein
LEPFALDRGECPLADLAIILTGILKLADRTCQDDRPEGHRNAALLNVGGVLGRIADRYPQLQEAEQGRKFLRPGWRSSGRRGGEGGRGVHPGPHRIVQPALPAGTRRTQAVKQVGIQSQRDHVLGVRQLRPAGTAIGPYHRLAVPDFGILEKRLQQLRGIVGIIG